MCDVCVFCKNKTKYTINELALQKIIIFFKWIIISNQIEKL